jgi:acetyl-CoA acetyltransferase
LRLDPLSASVVAAAGARPASTAARPRKGVVVGTAAATIEIDEAFDRRLRERGPRGVDPRRFPATSPNLAAGNCTIAFGLLGPSLAVGAGPDADIEALMVAVDLIAAGDADSVIVVAAEQVGDAVEAVRKRWVCSPGRRCGSRRAPARCWMTAECRRMRAREARSRPLGPDRRRGWPAFLAALASRRPVRQA